MKPRQLLREIPGRLLPLARGGALAAGVALLLSCTRAHPQKELRVLWTEEILTLDPNERFEHSTDMYAMNVFEPLLKYDRQLSFAPALATRWDFVGGHVWRFVLRQGVTFQDGTPLTPEDVIFTIDRIRSRPQSDLYAYLASVTDVRKVDETTIEIVSNRPAGLLSALSSVYILPRKLLLSRGEKAFFEHPVGTGPYRFVEWKAGQKLVLEGWSGYRGGLPAFPRAVFLQFASSAEMWKVARPPSILLGPSRATWTDHEKDSAFKLVSRPGLTVQYLVVNLRGGSKNPLSKLPVRRALRAALDLAKLIEKIGGQAFPASQFVTPDIVGYDPSLTVPRFEPGAARRMLAEAGYPGGLTLRLSCPEGPSKLVDELVAQLGAAGVKINLDKAPSRELFDRIARCDGDLHLTGWVCATGDASELFEGNFYGRTADQRASTLSGCGYGRPDLDDLIDQIANTVEPEQRRDLLQGAMRRVVEDLPWIPLLVSYDRYALTPDLVWEPRPDGEIYLPDVRAK